MQTFNLFALILGSILLMGGDTLEFSHSSGDKPLGKSVAVVELFTSEGCSSCPPADRLLSEIVDRRYDDVDVIALSFHVDYWDYIGWKDPYADSRFTDRQRTYARKLQSYQVYTPQMVVNGQYEFVGSSRSKWQAALNAVKSESPEYQFDIEEIRRNKDQIQLKISSTDRHTVIANVAVVERNLSQNVTRGENRGRKLSHDNVVRAFDSEYFGGEETSLAIALPKNINENEASVVIYLQEKSNYQVIGARQYSLADVL